MEQQSTVAGSGVGATATTPSNNPRRRKGVYRRIKQLKQKCEFALDPPETPGENADASLKFFEEDKDLPQSYRDHIQIAGTTSPSSRLEIHSKNFLGGIMTPEEAEEET